MGSEQVNGVVTLLERLAFPPVPRAVDTNDAVILELTGPNAISEERLREIEAQYEDMNNAA